MSKMDNRSFKIVWTTESGLSEYYRVRGEDMIAPTLASLCNRQWSELRPGDVIRVIEDEPENGE